MALKWGTTTISSTHTVKFNDTEVKKIYWNDTLIWEKATSSVCSNCGGDGYAEATCYECYGAGSGKCAVCKGNKLATGSKCTSCLGLSVSYLCNGCGTTIYVSSFKKTGTTNTVDYSKSYTCGRCGAYYTNLDDVHDKCRNQACKSDVSLLGFAVGSCQGGYKLQACTTCGNTGKCSFCGGDGETTVACSVCNGGGSGGGDTSSD